MRKLVLLLLCVISTVLAYGAADPLGISVSASVNKTVLTLEDELILTVTVDGATGDFTPQLPSLPAFNVFARSTSKTIHNFHATTTFEYIMMPRMQGKVVIGPISIHYGNKIYKTDPINVTIYRTNPSTAPTAQPSSAKTQSGKAVSDTRSQQPVVAQAPANMPFLERTLYNRAAQNGDKDYFMVAGVSSQTPLVNQNVTLAERFYYAKPFSNSAPYTAPTISNLFLEEIGRSEGSQTILGRQYDYIEIRYNATGVTQGKAEIGPAKIDFVPVSQRGASLFDRMFATMAADPQTVTSNKISLAILPVPTEGQPDSFYGAVGSGYTISAGLDRNEVEAGDAVNLTVQVKGPGNLKATSDLKIPEMRGFKTYEVASTAAAVPDNGTLKSYKVFKTVLVPLSSGSYTIPAIDWSYYDPALKQYRIIRTQPLSLKVTPSSKTDSGFDFSAHSDLGNGFQELGKDIRYLKAEPYTKQFGFLDRLANWSVINYIAGILVIIGIIFALMDKRSLTEKRALTKAKAQLKHATNAETIANALSTYLQIKYDVHTASLPLRDIQEALKKKGCAAPQIEQFSTLWQQLNAVRFAPATAQEQGVSNLSHQVLQLLNQFEKGGSK